MILKNGMLLFHGSYTPVEEISLDRCTRGKDFGKGFYLTSDLNQAQNFIKTSLKKAQRMGDAPMSQDYGFVSSYRVNIDEGVKIHVFDKADKEWLWFISQNRRVHLAELLQGKIDPNISNSDIIVGKIANDTTNPVITAYLNGLYGDILSDEAIDFAIKQLMPEHLVDQYCFLTDRAIKCLEFQEARKYAV